MRSVQKKKNPSRIDLTIGKLCEIKFPRIKTLTEYTQNEI